MAKSKASIAKPKSPSLQVDEDRSKALVVERLMSFSGPLPPPSLLMQYNESIPNGAERILAMAERQSVHRESLESKVVEANIAAQTRGAYFAFLLGLVSIIGGMFLISTGKSVTGLVSIISSMGILGGAFIYNKLEQKQERMEKSNALQARRRGTSSSH